MRLKYIYQYLFSMLVITAILTNLATAQEKRELPERCLYRFDHLQRKQTWSGSYNAAGLNLIDFNSASYIEGYFNKGDGPFVPYYGSDDSYDFGIRTSSYTKVKKTTFFGKLDYNNFKGKNMAWSGLIYPERYLYTVGDDRPSNKTKESYKLSGGFSSNLSKSLLFGARINYETAMAAKLRDLRHRTDLLDFETTAGLIYKSKHFNIGANYYYRKFHERVDYSKIADDEIFYSGYLFKGLWYGMTDIWSQTNLHLDRAVIDVVQGGSLQLEYSFDNFRFFNQFTYKLRDGYGGEGYDKAFETNKSTSLEYNGIVQFEQEQLRHYLRVNTNYVDAQGYDKIYNDEKIGGISVLIQYGENKAVAKRSLNLNAEYELALGSHKFNPDWNFIVGVNSNAYSLVSSIVLPYYSTQEINIFSAYGVASKNFVLNKGMIDLSLSAAYAGGSGVKNKLKNVVTSLELSEEVIPYQNESLLNREYEFLTKERISGGVGFRYSKFVRGAKKMGACYLDMQYKFNSASNIKYHSGGNSGVFSLAIGYAF